MSNRCLFNISNFALVDFTNVICRWFFGEISRTNAEGLLMGNPFNINGSYLIRESASKEVGRVELDPSAQS